VDVAHAEQGADVGVVRLSGERIDEKNAASMPPVAASAAIWASPPCGPGSSSSTSRPTLSRMSRAV